MRTLPRLSLMLALLLGCGDESTRCTASYAVIRVTVLTRGGAPVSGLTISATTWATRQSFTVPQLDGFGGPGSYVVFDDGLRGRILASGDSLHVTGSDSVPRFTANFVVHIPDGCHVRKVFGPDTVVVP